MATRYIGMTQSGPQLNHVNVIGAASGGTLAGSQVIQVVFDDTEFAATAEGRQRFLSALEIIHDAIEAGRFWPVTTAT